MEKLRKQSVILTLRQCICIRTHSTTARKITVKVGDFHYLSAFNIPLVLMNNVLIL